MLVVRDSRIADCAKKNRIEILAQHVERTCGQRDSFTQVLFCTPIELGEFQSGSENIIDTAQNAHGFPSHVDALALLFVRQPKDFQVVVTNNMFGDIVTDLAAALQGGLGMAASGNINPNGISLFEPVHGSSPPLAGKNIANPMGSILTSAMLLEHLGLTDAARAVENAVIACVNENKTTQDIGGKLGTREVGEAVLSKL